MIRPLLVWLFLFSLLAPSLGYYAVVSLYDNGGCGGESRTDALDFTCYSYPTFGHSISALQMDIGSCIKIHTGLECGGDTYMLAYPNRDLCDLPCCGWNDNVMSVEDCNTYTSTIYCPEGTYVRELGFDVTNGYTIYCYAPGGKEPLHVFNTHGSPDPAHSKCPIAGRGIVVTYDESWGLDHSPELQCEPSAQIKSNPKGTVTKSRSLLEKSGKLIRYKLNRFETDEHYPIKSHKDSKEPAHSHPQRKMRTNRTLAINPLECDDKQAMAGVEVLIDEAGVIKETTLLCWEVPNPAELCEPVEILQTTLVCDNASGATVTCKYEKTTGVAESRTITETERQEMAFYAEFGYTVGGNIGPFSAEMTATLGQSELVAYEWSVSDTETWSLEETVGIEVTVPPYTAVSVNQLNGKCSFHGVQTTYFRVLDARTNETMAYALL